MKLPSAGFHRLPFVLIDESSAIFRTTDCWDAYTEAMRVSSAGAAVHLYMTVAPANDLSSWSGTADERGRTVPMFVLLDGMPAYRFASVEAALARSYITEPASAARWVAVDLGPFVSISDSGVIIMYSGVLEQTQTGVKAVCYLFLDSHHGVSVAIPVSGEMLKRDPTLAARDAIVKITTRFEAEADIVAALPAPISGYAPDIAQWREFVRTELANLFPGVNTNNLILSTAGLQGGITEGERE